MTATLVLHNYWRSSASYRVRIALALKQLAYDYVVVDILAHAQQGDAYRALNPMAQVPTLEVVEDGRRLGVTQSLPIIEYLDERWPATPLLPRDPYLRARCRALAEIVNAGIQPLQNLSVTRKIKELGGDDAAWPRAWIERGLAAYAAAAPPALPAVGNATRVTPKRLAIVIAIARPRLLKLPVGSCDSSLIHRFSMPSCFPSRGQAKSGVIRSPSETTSPSS